MQTGFSEPSRYPGTYGFFFGTQQGGPGGGPPPEPPDTGDEPFTVPTEEAKISGVPGTQQGGPGSMPPNRVA